jgi:hypothetical protein
MILSTPMRLSFARASALAASTLIFGVLAGCGGGKGGGTTGPTAPGAPSSTQVSGASPLASGCGMVVPTGSSESPTIGSAIQPQIAAVPGAALVGVWEQDRWSGLGARGILAARSADGGATWSAPQALQFSRCAGGAGPGAGYDRASDPWVTFAGNNVVLASALAFSANGFTGVGFVSGGGLSAVLVSRSTDGGLTWSVPVAVTTDSNAGAGPFFFNDRDAITADTSGRAYLVWDRLPSDTALSAPSYLSLSTDSGATWSTPKVLFDPGAGNEAFDNQVVILLNGNLLDFFTQFNGALTTSLQVIRSTDLGLTWTATPVKVADMVSVGTPNPITSGAIRDSALIPQVAVDPASGHVAAVWQQSFTTGAFDGIALSVSTDNGATWSTPKQINGATGAAAFSPTVRYAPGGVIAVTYYDLRDYAAGSTVLSTSAWFTESADGGATWHELRLQSPFDLNHAPLANLNGAGRLFLGDNQGLALYGSNPLPFYAATNSSGAHVYATQSPSPLTSPTAHVYQASRSP